MHPSTPHENTRAEKALVVVGIVVLGFNLRPAAVSIGPVLDEIRAGLGMDEAAAGVLTMLPVLAFGSFGALAPRLARQRGLHRVTLLSLVALVVGLAARPLTGSAVAFLALSAVGLAGMATANVLLPSLVKLHFPDRVGLLTSLYTTALALGLTSASVLTVPLAEQTGSWRGGLGAWAVAALVAAAPWVALVRHDQRVEPAAGTVGLAMVARTRLGWAMAALFGLQSMQAYSVFGWFAQIYRDAGFEAGTAGLLLGVVTGASIPLSLLLPRLVARRSDQTPLIGVLVGCYAVGYVGMILAPVAGAWLWALLVGSGTAIFPVALTLIGLRARTSAGTAALSGFTQSVGYLASAAGPLAMGLLYGLTGGWTVPLALLLALLVPQLVAGLMVARPSYVEDQLEGVW